MRMRAVLATLLGVVLVTIHGAQAWAAAALCLSQSAFGFGNVAVGTSQSHVVTVTSCGTAAWTFTRIAAHPATAVAFSIATTCATATTLAPGASCSATIDFAPAAAGQISGGLYLDGASASVLLAFYGRGIDARAGTASLRFVPGAADFGEIAVGASASAMTVTLANDGPAALTPTAMVLNGPDARDFSGTQDVCRIGTPIAAGGTCTIALRFAPGAQGSRIAELVVDAPELAELALLPVSGTGIAPGTPATTTLVEYRHAALDHYFMTPLATEIALCDASTPPCSGWQRTGRTLPAWSQVDAHAQRLGVCRFYNDSFAAASTHFYALHGLGCEETLAGFPDWKLESAALFAAQPPAADGRCAQGTVPVYRLYNDGRGGVPNHRFTTDLALRAQMIATGWLPEGFGIGVAFCVPG